MEWDSTTYEGYWNQGGGAGSFRGPAGITLRYYPRHCPGAHS